MKSFLFLLTLVTFAVFPPSVDAGHIWSRRVGNGNCGVQSIALDSSGNVVVTGSFLGSGNFGGTTFPSHGDYDIFLAKYDPSGHHIWSHAFGSSGYDGGSSVDINGAGEVFVTGGFAGSMSFGGSVLTTAGDSDIFLAKFDADGNHLRSASFGSSAGDGGNSVAVDASGNVIMTGSFAGTADFGGGPLVGGSTGDIFVAKYDINGNHVWSKRFGFGSSDWGKIVAVDNADNVLVSGFFSGNVDFGGGPLPNAGQADIFLVKYASNGTHVWSRSFGSTFDDYVTGMSVDDEQGIALTGFFWLPLNMGGTPLVSAGATDVFVARYDLAGNHLWSKRIGGPSYDQAYAVDLDDDGNVGITGRFYQTADFGGGPLTSVGNDDGFTALYDPSGSHIWSFAFGDQSNDVGYAIAFTQTDHVLFGGSVIGTVNFGGDPIASGGFLAEFHGVVQPTAVGDIAVPPLALGAFPNPFNPRTSISITARQSMTLRVTIHDVRGNLVRSLYSGTVPAGTSSIAWDGRNDNGSNVGSGVYFCRAAGAREVATSKLTLVK